MISEGNKGQRRLESKTVVGNKYLSFTSVSCWARPAFPQRITLSLRFCGGGEREEDLSTICCFPFFAPQSSQNQSVLANNPSSLSSPLFLPEAGWLSKEKLFSLLHRRRTRKGEGNPLLLLPPPLQKATFPHIPFGSRTGNRGLLLSSSSFSHRGERSVPWFLLVRRREKKLFSISILPFSENHLFCALPPPPRRRISSFYKIPQRCRSSRNPSF